MAPLAWALAWLTLSVVITLAFVLGAALGRRKALEELTRAPRPPRRLPHRHIIVPETTPTSH